MADPKYENLPGIAYDQPDVYESGDLPEVDQPETYEEEENECIEQLHLSVKDSFNKFKGKFVNDNVDFSDRLSRKTRTGYRTGEWELAAQGESESLLERYDRLRCEFTDLLDQLSEEQKKASESDKDKFGKMAAQMASTKRVLDELRLHEDEKVDPKIQQIRQAVVSSAKELRADTATARLKLQPESVNLAQTTRIAQLEHRLHRLEAAAGVRDEEALRRLQAATGEATICSAAATLAARAAMLRPTELAAAEARVTSLLANVDVLKAAVQSADPEQDAKINELYKALKEIDSVSQAELLERLEALAHLHSQASKFGKSLSELEALQSSIASGVQNNKELLQGVQEVFAHNAESLHKEIKKLDERISKLATA